MSTVKVNTVDKRTGGTLTLGGCGTTVTLGAGATQSGFGRTGTVDWCTTAKTAPFTGVSGNGYFVNTTSGVVTVTLPATPSAGDIISIADYASTFQTNNLTLCRNSSKINGECFNATLNTEGQSITLVYVDATRGWKNTMDSTSNVSGAAYVTATGGTITCCGDYKIHTFTADGCFSVSCAGNPAGSTTIDYLVVAGGGGGGGGGCGERGGGGGAGGYRESFPNPATGGLPVSIQSYPITVGAGGGASLSGPARGTNGNDSIFSTITSTGGGGGGGGSGLTPGSTGGSGGGASSFNNSGPATGGTGNTPPTSPSQGNNGGDANGGPNPDNGGGGGGGAGGVGTAYPSPSGPSVGGSGGIGSTTLINPSPTVGTPGPAPGRYFAGGGGGGAFPSGAPTVSAGGAGGGGAGRNYPVPPAVAGTTNTGGGGGGGAAAGGSGIVVIRYKFQ
jgi:hypothetical protein